MIASKRRVAHRTDPGMPAVGNGDDDPDWARQARTALTAGLWSGVGSGRLYYVMLYRTFELISCQRRCVPRHFSGSVFRQSFLVEPTSSVSDGESGADVWRVPVSVVWCARDSWVPTSRFCFDQFLQYYPGQFSDNLVPGDSWSSRGDKPTTLFVFVRRVPSRRASWKRLIKGHLMVSSVYFKNWIYVKHRNHNNHRLKTITCKHQAASPRRLNSSRIDEQSIKSGSSA